ncbi:hypothetical protein ACS0TY_030544 [Phlomoides rotata]
MHHVIVHNHPLSRLDWNHLHRSKREITNEKRKAIEDMISSGMGGMDSFRYMAHDAGGDECVGHTAKDHLNCVNTIKMEAVKGGDAQNMVDMLHAQSVEETDFFFRVKFNEEGRFCTVFWRDTMMMEDYDLFGDVVVFDTTYRTNKYNLICAPFVGLNHHKKNVFFACAFLADETIESFKWLFETFKKSMRGRCPVTLLTDQDHAIASAIEQVFPDTRHRLCLWHLHQNAVSHFGQLKRDRSFKDMFHKCLSGCDTEEEFESCWMLMIQTYALEKYPWFERLYKIKTKWCTALNKDFFSAGLLSSQRSESTNHSLGFNTNKSTTLSKFYEIFVDKVADWRKKEKNDEFQCSRKIPHSALPLTGLLGHAAKVYTLRFFSDFETEFIKCISACCTHTHVEDNIMFYVVSTESDGIKHRVKYDYSNKLISCSCKKFESVGLLCFHCLRVLNINSVCEIPNCYILKRWTKVAKSELWDRFTTNEVGIGCKTKNGVPWRHEMARKYYNLLLQCQENDQAREIIENSYSRDFVTINTMIGSTTSTKQVEHSDGNVNVLDPEHSVTKGRSKRIKGHFQRNNKKKKSGDTSSELPPKEFGSKTPVVRLF